MICLFLRAIHLWASYQAVYDNWKARPVRVYEEQLYIQTTEEDAPAENAAGY